MNTSTNPEITRDWTLKAFDLLRKQAQTNGVSDMSLDEINDEIKLARLD